MYIPARRPRLVALAALSLGFTLASCGDSTPPPRSAYSLLTFVFFHVDPINPDYSKARPLPANLKVENIGPCAYRLVWDETAGTAPTRTQVDMTFSPSAKLRIQPVGKGYWQHIDGATATIFNTEISTNQTFSKQKNATYDDIMRNSFLDDGLSDRAVWSFNSFIANYCKPAGS